MILDGVTLEKLHTMHPPQEIGEWEHIVFSPGSRLLTGYALLENCIVSWDLQTGGLLSKINTSEWGACSSVSYSPCGTMIGGLFDSRTIIICNVLSGAHVSSHSIQQPTVQTIWTHAEFLQFATIEPGSITIWQDTFNPNYVPTKVGSLSTPNNLFKKDLVVLPNLLCLAFIYHGKVLVWDAESKKMLLKTTDIKGPGAISFSPDGCFFVCGTWSRDFHIWKKSPAGYLSHQKFVSGANGTRPLICPNGESVVSSSDKILQLWHTENPPTSLPNTSMHTSHYSGVFFIEFSPDESLVAVTEWLSNTVTVIDIESGSPWLVIDTDTKTCGLRMTGDRVIVVGDGKIVTWNLPARDCVSNARININDSVQTTTFTHSSPIEDLHASISPNLSYVAIVDINHSGEDLFIYNTHTGEELAVVESNGDIPGFTPSSYTVWCAADDGKVDQWGILQKNGSNGMKLKKFVEGVEPHSGFPWHSSAGYQVTDDGWILSSSGKRLFWLPHHWRQDGILQRKWSGKFLVLWNQDSVEPYILELEV